MNNLTAEKLIEKYGFTMTPEQVAEVLGLVKDTVLRILQRKEIVARKSGSRWIISTEKVAEYLTTSEPEKAKPWRHEKGQKLIL
ncbi:MAG TPA: helix-turn-helix domain-containing protein [Clostridia bacterium]|nr:helix-turn-helix domain-containing protein [Clostridia bacterium]